MSKIFFADSRHLSISANTSMRAVVEYRNETARRIVHLCIATFVLFMLIVVPQHVANSRVGVDESVIMERRHKAAQDKLLKEEQVALEEKRRVENIAREKQRRQDALLAYLSTSYTDVSKNALRKILQWSDEASTLYSVDQTLILSVIAKESRFNPYAKSTGNAEGLMQVIPFWHKEKMEAIGGVQNIVDPRANILTGTRVFKEYLDKAGQDANKALQMYLGDPKSPDANLAYANKVLTHRKLMMDHVNRTLKTGAV